MSELLTRSGFSADAFAAFVESRCEPDWLRAQRQAAWEAFEQTALPDRRQEEWMRTDIRGFRFEQFAPPDVAGDAAAGDGSALPAALLGAGVDLAGSHATLNSHAVRSQLDPELARQGVLFGSLDRLVVEHGAKLREHLFRAVDGRADKFAALHAALWCGGSVLYVPRGVAVAQPLHILSALTDGGADFGHQLVVLEEGAEATLLAETASTSPQAGGLHCGAIELVVAPGARLRYVNLQNWGTGVWHFAHQQGLVQRDASLQWTIGALGARLAKVNQHVALVGEHAAVQVNGAMFTEGRQQLTYNTLQHHRASHGRSDLLYKGAVQDHSRLVWRGMIRVDEGAQKTDGYQRDDNLILSEHARADSIPGLEILANDVRCTHGATLGRVDDELIFYAMSRGLTRKEAVRLVVTGFFQQVFDRITIDSVREALAEAIGRRVREYQ